MRFTQRLLAQVSTSSPGFIAHFKTNPAADPALFKSLHASTGLNAAQYDVFQRNFAARQSLTNPMISKGMELLTRGSHHDATTHLALTLAEEGGADKKGRLKTHSELLQRSIFGVGERVFGLEQPDIRRIQHNLEQLHLARFVREMSQYQDRTFEQCLDFAISSRQLAPNTFGGDRNGEAIISRSTEALHADGILPKTIEYADHAHRLLRSNDTERTLGTLTALELYGENMMAAYEAVAQRYQSHFTAKEYKRNIDRYFDAHRDGDVSLDDQHVKRMEQTVKAVCSSPEQMQLAIEGGEEFSKAQLGLFNALHERMNALEHAGPKVRFDTQPELGVSAQTKPWQLLLDQVSASPTPRIASPTALLNVRRPGPAL